MKLPPLCPLSLFWLPLIPPPSPAPPLDNPSFYRGFSLLTKTCRFRAVPPGQSLAGIAGQRLPFSVSPPFRAPPFPFPFELAQDRSDQQRLSLLKGDRFSPRRGRRWTPLISYLANSGPKLPFLFFHKNFLPFDRRSSSASSR